MSRYRYSGTGNSGTLAWLLQRISAIVLFFVVFIHFIGMITGTGGFSRFVLGCILIFGIFHAVNGLKMITDDYVSSLPLRFLLLLFYWFVGVFVFIQGLSILP